MPDETQKHVLNVGSLNIDHVYQVEHFMQPGETQPCLSYQRSAGGKGFNQSIALARAGLRVTHAGRIGQDGEWLRNRLIDEGVDVSLLEIANHHPTGHAIIQVAPKGENSILIHGGANQTLDEAFVGRVFSTVADLDLVVLQNETNAVAPVLAAARRRGLPVALNPAPMTFEVRELPLAELSILIVNEVEAGGLVGAGRPEELCQRLAERFPKTLCILTMGERGVSAARGSERWEQPANCVRAVDTTAAGDTFLGFFLAELLNRECLPLALKMGSLAASLSVTRLGAADSIPTKTELFHE